MKKRAGLILTGGGARAAYQVGVLKAIAEFLPRNAHNPFPVICGTSAGALNAATLAINARNFRKGVHYLNNIWKNFHANQIYRTDAVGVFANTILWVASIILSGFGIKKLREISLLDNSPLVELLEEVMQCEKIQDSIDAGLLHALSVTASGYGSGQSVTFYQGASEILPWRRARRVGIPTKIENKHLLASSALPFFFPATQINREYFGDGSMRQIAPISSALHLGATQLLIIGITEDEKSEHPSRSEIGDYPSLAQIAGHALNGLFLDSMEVDMERLESINNLVSMMPEEMSRRADLTRVDILVIKPSQPIEKIAARHIGDFPWTIRLLLRLVGAAHRSGATLISYLLSEGSFCQALINLGYRDAFEKRDEILHFLDALPDFNKEMPQ